MTLADLLPWLNLLLLPAVGLLLRVSAQLATLAAVQDHHADELRALRLLAPTVAAMQAAQAEHGRRLDQLTACRP